MSAALRIGTRGSTLALAQSGAVAEAIGGNTELLTIATPDGAPATDKSRFTGELERALTEKRIDIAVHSAKDLPGEQAPGLVIAAVPVREDPADVWIGEASSLDTVAAGATVGTSSLRRRSQILAARPDLSIAELRGNVDTRLGRLAAGDYDGIVLALAGLARLGRSAEASFRLNGETLVPAPGQGALALQTRRGDGAAAAALEPLDDPPSHDELRCERAAVTALGASCNTPVGIRARADGATLSVAGYCGLPDGSEWITDSLTGEAAAAADLGRELAARMAAAGARELLGRSEQAVRDGVSSQ